MKRTQTLGQVEAEARRRCMSDGHRGVPANWKPDGSPRRLHCAFCGEPGVLIEHECRSQDWLER